MIIVTHDREAALRYADRIVTLDDGEIVDDRALFREKMQEIAQKEHSVGRLSIVRKIRLGANAFKTNPFRFIISLLLTVCTVMFFGFSMLATAAEGRTTELNTLFSEGQSVFFLMPDRVLDDRQTETLLRYDPDPIPLYETRVLGSLGQTLQLLQYAGEFSTEDTFDRMNYYLNLCSIHFLAELGPSEAEKAALTPDPRFSDPSICRLPERYDEIALTDFVADLFLEQGFSDGEADTQIDSVDELIGKQLGSFTICGIYATEMKRERLAERRNEFDLACREDPYYASLYDGSCYALPSTAFVKRGFGEMLGAEADGYLLRASSANDAVLLIHALEYDAKETIRLRTVFSRLVEPVAEMEYYLSQFASYAVAVLSVFSLFLCMNFLYVSMKCRKREYGVLCSLGATKKDVTLIFLLECLIFALGCYILSAFGVLILSVCLNAGYHLEMLVFSVAEALWLFLLTFGLLLLAAIPSLTCLLRSSPIALINGE